MTASREALLDVLAEELHAEPPLGCPILGILASGANAVAIGATTADIDAALARRPFGLRRGVWPLTADTESL